MDDLTLGLAHRSDAEAISAMSRRLIEAGLQPAWPAHRILWHMHHPESIVLTAKFERELVGFAIMQYADVTAHLNLFAVEPSRRRRGIGRKLLNWLEETAMVAGTFVISLELRSTNSGARAFYEALGYREIGRVPGYYQGREDAIRMARDLRVGRGATQTR